MKRIVLLKEYLHSMRMKEDTEDEFDINIEEYDEVVKKFNAKNTNIIVLEGNI